MDVTELDKMPKEGGYWESSFFFLFYVLLSGLFLMNLFIAFIISGFKSQKGITRVEVIFDRFKRQLKLTAPVLTTFPYPENPLSQLLRAVLKTNLFKNFSTMCVLGNVLFMLMNSADSDVYFEDVQNLQNLIFYILFLFEVCLCIIGYGFGGLYDDKWLLWDFLLCIGIGVGYLVQIASFQAFTRSLRLVRLLRVMTRHEKTNIVIVTTFKTMPQLLNVIVLVLIIYSMCSALGVQLFATAKSGIRMGPTSNFENFGSAFQSIFQIVVGDKWMILVADGQVSAPSCTTQFTGKSYGDCGSEFSAFYFILVIIVCKFIVLNLFTGLIFENYSHITEDLAHREDDQWSDGPSLAQLNSLSKLFQQYSGESGFVSVGALNSIFSNLPQPFGYR